MVTPTIRAGVRTRNGGTTAGVTLCCSFMCPFDTAGGRGSGIGETPTLA